MPSNDDLIAAAAAKHGIRPALLAAVVQHESGGNPLAVGDSGHALGLMQVHLGACKDVGQSWPAIFLAIEGGNADLAAQLGLEAGAAYLAKMLKAFGGGERLAVMAYNQGPTVIRAADAYAEAVEHFTPFQGTTHP